MNHRDHQSSHERPEVLSYAVVPAAVKFSKRLNAIRRKCDSILMCAVAGYASAIFVCGDWCFSATCAAFLSALLALSIKIVHRKLFRLANKIPGFARIAVSILAGIVVGLGFRIDEEKAFRMAFGVDPPSAISEFHARMLKNIGPPGDTILLVRFRANRATVQSLLNRRHFELDSSWHDQAPDSQTTSLPTDEWPSLWDYVFGGFAKIGGGSWQNVAPMAFPEVYSWNNYELQTGVPVRPRSTSMLYDSDSGRCYVLYVE